MTKAIAYYNINMATNLEILDTDGERIFYRVNDGDQHFSKIYYNQKGEPFFIDRVFTGSRIYLDECLKISFLEAHIS